VHWWGSLKEHWPRGFDSPHTSKPFNPYNMDNIKVTLTPTELGDIIDNAFNLGKVTRPTNFRRQDTTKYQRQKRAAWAGRSCSLRSGARTSNPKAA